jgi:hypothetical protein
VSYHNVVQGGIRSAYGRAEDVGMVFDLFNDGGRDFILVEFA